MLPSQHRVKSGSDFKLIMRSGKRVSSPAMTVYAHPNDLNLARFGFVVSKAVGNAVTRNLVKRRLRAAAALQLNSACGLDLVVRANAAAAKESYGALAQVLGNACEGLRSK